MKRIVLSLIITWIGVLAFAQQFSQEKAIAEINAAAASIRTMQCDFVQTKSLKMLGDKMVSTGIMKCQQPDKLLWQYESPYTYTFVLSGGKVMLKKGNRSDVIDVEQNKMFKEIARIMMNSVLGKCLNDTKDFKASVQPQGNQYVVTLLPLKKEMKQMFTKIILKYDKSLATVNVVELYEKNGDYTVIELKNIKKNSPIDGSVFKID